MRTLLRGLRSYLSTSTDDAYWNEKATEVTYLSALQTGAADPSPALEPLTLSERAAAVVGPITFEGLLEQLEIDTSYPALTKTQMGTAVGMGILGVLLAHFTNSNGEALEAFFKRLHEPYKAGSGPSPIDYRTGAKHRYIFGHDFNLWQKLPEDYTIGGASVGGRTLYSLILEQMQLGFPEAGFIGGHVKAILHILTHYLSDLPTTDGLPLPFSSLFTQWVKDETKVSGYSAENPLMDALGKEYGTINAADIASYAIIKMLLKGHHGIAFYQVCASDDEKALHLAQMSTIAYGTAVVIQMMLLASGTAGRTGKLNYLIAGPFLWNAGKVVLICNRQHREIVQGYDRSLALLENESITFDDWVKCQCA
ncbi:hypothetical protein QEL93_000948 [Pseudomonas putida]|nr:hypothetical protein [Pseudomonas putida]